MSLSQQNVNRSGALNAEAKAVMVTDLQVVADFPTLTAAGI